MINPTFMRIVRGLSALLVIAVIVFGIPFALWTMAGWPLPHALPSTMNTVQWLTSSQLSDGAIIKILAVICWLSWTQLLLSLTFESIAAIRRRPARQLFAAGPMQTIAANLIASVILLTITTPRASIVPLHPTEAVVMQPLVYASSSTQPADVAPTQSVTVETAEDLAPTYVVCHRDTLWGIAQTTLGAGNRWQEIFDLNRGRMQPDGRSLTHARLIRPGWTLQLPSDAHIAPSAPVTSTTGAITSPSVDVPPATVPIQTSAVAPTQTDITTTTTLLPDGLATSTNAAVTEQQHASQVAPPSPSPERRVSSSVVMSSATVIGVSTAAGIAAASALLRLRRRRRYVPVDPEPGIARRDPLLTDSIKRLAYASELRHDDADLAAPSEVIPAAGVVSIGEQDGDEVFVNLSSIGDVPTAGKKSLDEARAMLIGLLAHRGADEVEAIVVGEALSGELFGNTEPFPGLRRDLSLVDVLSDMEITVARRSRMLEEAEVDDIEALRICWPEEPVPTMAVFVNEVSDSLQARLDAIVDAGRRLGIALISVETSTESNATRDGNQIIYTANRTSGLEMLDVLRRARIVDDNAIEYPQIVAEAFEPPEVASATSEKLVHISVLGPVGIRCGDREIESGMRTNSWELVAFLATRPNGVTKEFAMEMMWPTANQREAVVDFRAAVNSLRSELRELTGRKDVQFVERVNGRYRLNADEINCDLWTLEAELGQSRQLAGDGRRATLVNIEHLYGGPFAEGTEYLWAEECREDLCQRVLGALAALSQSYLDTDEVDLAIAALERAVEIEPSNEVVYVKLMKLHAQLGHDDAVVRTMRRLRSRAERLGVTPSTMAIKVFADIQRQQAG